MLCENYIGILETAGVPNLANNGINSFDDNFPIHRARIVRDWKRDNSVQEYSWSAHSAHLNPIEDVWAYMKRQRQCMARDHL